MGEVIPGPWEPRRQPPAPEIAGWRRGRPLPDRRPVCRECDRPFSRESWVPTDRVCRDCRAEIARRDAEAAANQPPSLFDALDPEGGDT